VVIYLSYHDNRRRYRHQHILSTSLVAAQRQGTGLDSTQPHSYPSLCLCAFVVIYFSCSCHLLLSVRAPDWILPNHMAIHLCVFVPLWLSTSHAHPSFCSALGHRIRFYRTTWLFIFVSLCLRGYLLLMLMPVAAQRQGTGLDSTKPHSYSSLCLCALVVIYFSCSCQLPLNVRAPD